MLVNRLPSFAWILRVLLTVVGCLISIFIGLYFFILVIENDWFKQKPQSTARMTFGAMAMILSLFASIGIGALGCMIVVLALWGLPKIYSSDSGNGDHDAYAS